MVILQERNYTEFSQHIEHFHRVPRGVFLGLFAYLIVHWIFKLENFGTEIILSSLLYIALLALVGVLSTAFETDLVFVDPSKGRLIPIDQWVESLLKPLVGVGLIFLLGRDLLEEARGGMLPCLLRPSLPYSTELPSLELHINGGIQYGEDEESNDRSNNRSSKHSTHFPMI